MQFAQNSMFQLLWGIILLIFFLRWSIFHREQIMKQFAQGPLLAKVAENFDSGKLIYKSILLVAVFIASIFALARPQWGSRLESVTRKGADLVLVLDTSASMAAEDLAPSRLAAGC